MSGDEAHHGQFLPLSVAAAIAHGSLVGSDDAALEPARLDAHLNYIAAELASILPVFSALNGAPQILPPERVARGHFTQRGELLHLPDGQPPIAALHIRQADLHIAIEQLRQRLKLPPA
jgi:hypothetical protein